MSLWVGNIIHFTCLSWHRCWEFCHVISVIRCWRVPTEHCQTWYMHIPPHTHTLSTSTGCGKNYYKRRGLGDKKGKNLWRWVKIAEPFRTIRNEMRAVLRTMLIIVRAGTLWHGPDYSHFPAISLIPLFYHFSLQCGATTQLWPCHNNHSPLVCSKAMLKSKRKRSLL